MFRPVAVVFFAKSVFERGLKLLNRGVVSEKVVHPYRSARRVCISVS